MKNAGGAMGIALYEHNQKAYDAALSLMDESGKAAVIHPTGTGKSFIGFKLAEEHSDSRICWLSPSEYIYRTQLDNIKTVADGYEPENICFMTYAKLMLTDEAGIYEIQPDYIILDEFHRCGAAEWGKGVARLLAAYPDVPILGLSATNIRYLDNQRDMADELFDGNTASEMTLGEAIVRNILLPPTYITSIYSYQKDLEKYQRKVKKAKNKIVRDTAQKYLDELRRTLSKADGLDVIFDRHIKDRHGKFIVFCANVDHMNEMTDRIPEWFGKIDSNPKIYRVYAEDSSSDKEFASFKQDNSEHLKLLFCIDMLNEGVHVEDISGVILFRPTVSPIIYKQQIGRALSASKGREPVIFDIVNNFQNLYSIGSIEEEMQEVINYYSGTGKQESIINEKFHVIDEVRDCRRLFDELEDTLSASWDMMFEAAKQFYTDYGNLIVPKRYKTVEDYSLGSWIETQRRVKKGTVPGVMTKERIDKLNSIGMIWESFSDFNFEQNYQYAKIYYKENGNLDVAACYITPHGFALGQWLQNLRSTYKGNRQHSLSPDRIKMLNDINMIWDKNEYLFEKNLSAAQKYYEEHGHLDVKHNYKTYDGISLGKWLSSVRRKYNDGKLSQMQTDHLNAVKMIWTTKYDDDWQVCYEKAAEYSKKYGNLDVPAAYKADGIALGKWIRRHRIDAKTGKSQIKITPERREKLDAVGMKWRADDSWDIRYNLLSEYHKEHGNIEISQSYVAADNIWLGKWLHIQKRIYAGKEKEQRLTREQIEKLNELGINWNINYKEKLFDEYLTELKVFYEEHGNLDIPAGYRGKNGRQLDKLVISLRKKYKNGSLSAEQVKRLEDIGVRLSSINPPNSAKLPIKNYDVFSQNISESVARL